MIYAPRCSCGSQLCTIEQATPTPEDIIMDKLTRSTQRKLALYYLAALTVVLAAVVIGLLVSSRADGATWRAAPCTSSARAAHIATGTTQQLVELQTGHGRRVWTDTLSYGIRYRTCDTSYELVIVYARSTHAVLSVFYVPAA